MINLTLEVEQDGEPGVWAEAGCRPGNEIILPGPCANRHCLRVLRLGGRFWLEGLTEDECLSLDEQAVAGGQAFDLASVKALRCRHSSWAVRS